MAGPLIIEGADAGGSQGGLQSTNRLPGEGGRGGTKRPRPSPESAFPSSHQSPASLMDQTVSHLCETGTSVLSPLLRARVAINESLVPLPCTGKQQGHTRRLSAQVSLVRCLTADIRLRFFT